MTTNIVGSASNIATATVSIAPGTIATKVVDARPGRKSLKLRLANAGQLATTRIAPTSTITDTNSYFMSIGDTLEIDTEAEIWASRPTATEPMEMGVIEMFD